MNEHVTEYLSVYHDGELAGRRLRQVEAHLDECEACRMALDRLRALSVLLQQAPAPAHLERPERFVAQVGLRLPRRQEQPPGKRVLGLTWRLAPAGLLGAWAFSQTVFIVAGLLMWVWRTPVGGEWLSATLSVAPPASWWAVFLQLLVLSVIGVCYCSWLASWWAYQSHVQRRG